MKRKIISLALCIVMLASMFVCGNVFAKTEVTVPARDIFSESFAGLSEMPSGWTISGTEGTDYNFGTDAIVNVAVKNVTVQYTNGFDTDGHSYTFKFKMAQYNWTPQIYIGAYRIDVATHASATSADTYCTYELYKKNSSGTYELINSVKGPTGYGYQDLQNHTFTVNADTGLVEFYYGTTLLNTYTDAAPSTSGIVKFYFGSTSAKNKLASASLTVDEYTYYEYEEGEIEVIDVDMKVGDYAAIGTYNDEAILWRCVAIDSNGPLMLADSIISLKAFDAKGESTLGSHARDIDDARAEYGSNYWNDANLRLWLNSNAAADTVIYSCGNEPTEENVWSGYNEYSEESGFLSNDNFTALERNAMKVVSQKNILNSVDADLATMGTTTHTYNADVDDALTNYAAAYSLTSSDKVFLLDIAQVQTVKANLGDYYMAKPSSAAINASEFRDIQALTSSKNYRYWLRTPYASAGDAYPEYVRYVDADGTIGYGKYPAYTPLGVRPAFYLDTENAMFGAGTGKVGDPYTIAVDVNATGDYYDAGFTYARSPMVHLNQSFANLSAAPEGWTVGGKNGANINFTETNGYATTINETGKNYSTSYMNYTKNIDMGDNYVVSSKRYKCGYNNYIYMYAGAASAAQTGSNAPSTGYALLFQGNVLKLYKDGVVKATSATLSLDNTSIFAIEVTGNTVKGVAYNTGGTEQASINFTDDSPITSGYCGYIFNSVRYPQIYDFTVKTVYPTVNECTNPFIFSKTFTENDSVAGLKEAGYILNNEAQSRSSFTSAGMKVTSSSSSIRYANNTFFGNYSFEWKNQFSYNSAGAYVNYADTSNYYKIDYGSIGGLNTVKVTKVLDGTATVLYTNNSGLGGFNSSAAVNKINVKSNYDGSVTLDISLKGGAFKLALTDMPGDADGDPIVSGGVGVYTTNTPATIPYIKVYTTPVNASNTPAYSLKYQVNNATVSLAAKGKTSLYMPVVEVGKEGTIIAAAFDGNKLIDTKVVDIYDFYGSPKIKVFDTSDAVSVRLKLKAFTWDSVDGMMPLELPYVLTDGYNE